MDDDMNTMQTRIIEYVKSHPHSDGLDVATALHLPVDIAYREIQSLLDKNILRKCYFGLATWFEVVA